MFVSQASERVGRPQQTNAMDECSMPKEPEAERLPEGWVVFSPSSIYGGPYLALYIPPAVPHSTHSQSLRAILLHNDSAVVLQSDRDTTIPGAFTRSLLTGTSLESLCKDRYCPANKNGRRIRLDELNHLFIPDNVRQQLAEAIRVNWPCKTESKSTDTTKNQSESC